MIPTRITADELHKALRRAIAAEAERDAARLWAATWKQAAKENREWRIRNLHAMWDVQAEKNVEELRANRAEEKVNKLPFYWTRPNGYPAEQCAEEGWYQWTERGLIYLGTTAEIAKALQAEVERLTAELEEWRSGKRQRSHVDSMLDGFGVDDIEDLFT